jgi:hypothetical protein
LISNSKEVKSDLIWNQFRGVWLDETNCEGTLIYEKGAKYVGFLKNNKRHGRGVYTYPSLEELKQGEAKHPNIKIDLNDTRRVSFSGEWEEDFKVKGLIINRSGNKYEGQLFDDEPHGKGVYTDASGSVY